MMGWAESPLSDSPVRRAGQAYIPKKSFRPVRAAQLEQSKIELQSHAYFSFKGWLFFSQNRRYSYSV
jgi:hypothetical protein